MQKPDNYALARDRAKAHFLGFDQQALIRTWGLKADESRLFLRFLGEDYGICRRTGAVLRLRDGQEAGFGVALSVFDLLCHPGRDRQPACRYAPVNSLPGGAPLGVATDFHTAAAARFSREAERFAAACLALGGEPVAMGDVGFRLPVFGGLSVIVKLYHPDEDFPASLTLLWDESMLQYVHYETVFYIAGCLLAAIAEKMEHTG